MAESWKHTRKTLLKLQNLLVCRNCSQPLNNPYYLESCRHTFCKTCIDCENCPQCNIPVQPKQITPDRLLSNILLLASQLKDVLDNDVSLVLPVLEKTKSNGTIGTVPASTPILSKTKCYKTNASTSREKMGSISSSDKVAGNCEMASPVHLKVQNASSPITSSGCDKKNLKGETPLHVACIKGDVGKVTTLLKNGANPNVKDNAGWTPLHEASHKDYVNIVKLLVKFGALINTPAYDNDTPLHDAVQTNSVSVVEFLIRSGADINARNARGLTPLDLATTKEVSDALQSTVSLSFSKNASNPATAAVKTVIQATQQIVVLCTGLSRKQKHNLDLCKTVMKFLVVQEFSDKVTHIVTECDGKGQCSRTLKYLRGILAGKWILNFSWIELCLEYGRKMDEEAFEVPGTKNHPDSFGAKKGRANIIQQLPPLFDGCMFYFYGNISGPWPQRSELIALVKSAGGKVLTREPRYDMKDEETSRVPYHMQQDYGAVRVNCFVVHSQEKTPTLNNLGDNVAYVDVTWLLDSISGFKLLPFHYKHR